MCVEAREKMFSAVQSFLKNPPVIIWGSGATVAFGLPSMGKLNDVLVKEIVGFNPTKENLEIELGKSVYEPQMSVIRKAIWDSINAADEKILIKLIDNDTGMFDGIGSMISKFREAHPQVVNIITTNYDCVLEHVMAFYGVPFTDGFNGKELSKFNDALFQTSNIVNLVKVHGSNNWFRVGGCIRYLKQISENTDPVIICPGKNKYQEAYQSPYRELIQKADDLIKNASSFLVIGFGFNDEHITPKIKEKVASGTPIVLVTLNVSDSCKSELRAAQKCIFLQAGDDGETSVSLKSAKDIPVEEFTIVGDYWKLENFMEVM